MQRWPGNILWQGGRLAAVIDWEDARLGDPLIDLAISRLDTLWIYGAAAMEGFTRGYLSIHAIDTAYLPLWDLGAALRLARWRGRISAGGPASSGLMEEATSQSNPSGLITTILSTRLLRSWENKNTWVLQADFCVLLGRRL